MMSGLGYLSLIIALLLATAQTILPIIGSLMNNSRLMSSAKPLALSQSFFVFGSFFILMFCFVNNDFSVAYVAQNSNTHLPLFYRVAAVWGAHEGSMLLWLTVLSLWTTMVALFNKRLPQQTHALVIAILGFISVGFLLYLIIASNPFLLLPYIPTQGRDLNPLLQDPGITMHPPMLYMGYVGFSVVFAFALSVLIQGKLMPEWVRWVRPWTLAAWCFLTLGITLGSWWSYRVLGWGGWWFWDPVENASFMPWLVGTALIHSLMVNEKRGVLTSWTILLAIIAFSLSLIGTFIVRSGVLISVHAFAIDPTRGEYILGFLFFVIGSSLSLYAWRANRLKGVTQFKLLSRETFLLFNNVFLVVAMATVLLGTLYPLLIESLGLGKLSVGAPYFNIVFIPLGLFLLCLMGIGVQVYWQQMRWQELLPKFLVMMGLSCFIILILWLVFRYQQHMIALAALILALFVILSAFSATVTKLQRLGGIKYFSQLGLCHYGMLVAHIGAAITVIGITISSIYSVESDMRMQLHDNTKLAGYQFKFQDLKKIAGANYIALQAIFLLSKNNQKIGTIYPEERIYLADQSLVSKVAIQVGFFRDLYIALGGPINDKTWVVRIYYKPFIRWIWAGGFLVALGGFLALLDRRYRQ